MTTPTIRDKFAESYNGTAIVEEADCAWRDADTTFERLLSDRYQRASAEASHKVKDGDENWTSVTKQYFGATALHRRIPFNDAALDGRTVIVRLRADNTRMYRDYYAEDVWNAEGRELVSNITFEPPAIDRPPGVAGRIFNSYRPLLSAAQKCGDQGFAEQLRTRLLQETLELKEAQSSEPDGLVLQAVVEHVWRFEIPDFSYIKFRDLSKRIWENHSFL